MSRPALASSRSTRILDLLASLPHRRLSLTEIARATGVNAASCLAIFGELSQRGYLCRHPSEKTYWLGPALIVAGKAAIVANPILERAQTMAERLRKDLGLPVLLSSRVGDEIVGVFSLPGNDGRTAGLEAGERAPLVPPIGASFIAWSAPAEAERWIARRTDGNDYQIARWLRETLARTRERGFHVTLRRPDTENIASMLTRAASGDRTSDFYRHRRNRGSTRRGRHGTGQARCRHGIRYPVDRSANCRSGHVFHLQSVPWGMRRASLRNRHR